MKKMEAIAINSGRRALLALSLRESGLTFKKVGGHFGATAERGRQLVAKGIRIRTRSKLDPERHGLSQYEPPLDPKGEECQICHCHYGHRKGCDNLLSYHHAAR